MLRRFLTALLVFTVVKPLGAVESTDIQASPPAVNLSELVSSPVPATARHIQFEPLDDTMGAVETMLSTYPLRGGDPGVLSVDGKDEAGLLKANREVASRSGKTLTIRRQNDKTFIFRNWARPAGRDHEGDRETFVYAGPLGNSGYQKVDVIYMHDAPGSFLLNPNNGEALFVHSTADRVSASKDHQRLMVMNNGLNPPFGLLVVTLGGPGHSVEMRCQGSRDGNDKHRIIPFFTGWHIAPHTGFGVVLLVRQLGLESSSRYEAVPVSFSKTGSQWHAFVPEPQRFVRSARITCWQ